MYISIEVMWTYHSTRIEVLSECDERRFSAHVL